MKTRIEHLQHLSLSFALYALVAGCLTGCVAQAFAAGPVSSRIAAEVSSSQMTPLAASRRATILAPFDTGKLAPETKLEGMTLHFNRSASQEAELQTLLAAQKNPSSPYYHQWLTPDEFGARFGMSDADLAKVEAWLERQGFSVDFVSRSKDAIRFSGTAGQANAAFATEIHTYALKTKSGVEKHFAPSTGLSVPSAIAGTVSAVTNLDDFRPKPRVVLSKARRKPNYTLNLEGSEYIFYAPGDIYTEYGLQSEYNAGYNGAGQTIAIVGQSKIEDSDIEAFETAAGLPVKDPTLWLVPDTGTAAFSAGDWTESSLDIEWSGAIAPGATINFVYTGDSANSGGAFESIEYAIDEKIANIISSSYGECEAETQLDDSATILEPLFEQAEAQGQTVISAAGDDGSTDCNGDTNLSTSGQDALAVDYPASSAYVVSAGGTEISQANANYETPGDGYFEAENTENSFILTSLQQYVPEQPWNEDATCTQEYNLEEGSSPICSGGGGVSSLFAKPAWQNGVPGLSSSITMRQVPDISLAAAIFNPGDLLCTSDQDAWQEGQEASCNEGFLDSSSGDPTVAGGTSFAAPMFAGMVALINQQKGYTSGQGLLNETLYKLASDSTTYAAAFNDIQTGNNNCSAASGYCSGSGETDYSAGVGYDMATGLGSPKLYSLASAWPTSQTTLIATTTSVSATNTAPTVNVSDSFTISVTSDTGSTVPTGTVNVSVDGGTAVAETLTSNGTYVYSYTFTAAGTHTVTAQYTGDSTHAASTGSVTITAAGTASGSGSFTLTASSVTVAQGSEGTSTVTVVPSGGYTGTVVLQIASLPSALDNLCGGFGSGEAAEGSVVVANDNTPYPTTGIVLDTNASDCATAEAIARTGKHQLRTLVKHGSAPANSGTGGKTAPAAIGLAGLVLAVALGRRSRKLRSLACAIALVAVGLAVSACGGSSSNTISDPPKGTYTIGITGQDSTNAAIPTATTSFTFVID